MSANFTNIAIMEMLTRRPRYRWLLDFYNKGKDKQGRHMPLEIVLHQKGRNSSEMPILFCSKLKDGLAEARDNAYLQNIIDAKFKSIRKYVGYSGLL